MSYTWASFNWNKYFLIQKWQSHLSLFHLHGCEHSFLDSQLTDILQGLSSEKYYIGLHLSISKWSSHAGANLPQKYFSSYICSMLRLKSVLIRFFISIVWWEVSTGDAILTRLIIKDYAISCLICGCPYNVQQAGKKHSVVFKSLYPFISKP